MSLPAATLSHPNLIPLDRRRLNALLLTGLLGWLVLVPIGLMALTSLKPQGMLINEGFTLEAFRGVLTSGASGEIFVNTGVLVLSSVFFALLIGLFLAWITERTRLRGRSVIRILIILPISMPPMLLSMAWVTLLSPRSGALNQLIEAISGISGALNIFSMPGMVFVLTLVMVPTSYLILMPSVLRVSAEFEDAARASGASYAYILQRISLPMLAPAILAAAIFLTIGGIAHFDIPGTIGMPVRINTLSTQIYAYIYMSTTGLPLYGHVGVMGLFTILLILPMVLLYQRLISRESRFVTLHGKGGRSASLDLGSWTWAAWAVVVLYVSLAVILPLATVMWLSLMPYQIGISRDALALLTVRNYETLLGSAQLKAAAINTVIVGLSTATLVIIVSTWIAYTSTRSQTPGRAFIGFVSFMPQVLPGVILGATVTYLYLWLAPRTIYGTIWILIIAMTTSYIAYGSRATGTALIQSGRSLEEAAKVSGAGLAYTLRRILVPLMSPALWGIWIWVLAHALRELSLVIVLSNERNNLISTLMWQYWSSGRVTQAAAVGIMLSVIVGALVLIWQIISQRNRT